MPGSSFHLLELCCGGIDDVLLASRHGVERIELNSGLALGGLTPSAALLDAARREYAGTIVAMLRPREGGFCYSQSEFHLMLDDARRLVDLGADGLAVGFQHRDGRLDQLRCEQLRLAVPHATLVCHRAFDVLADRDRSLQQLIDCGFERVLTSGGAPTAFEGAAELLRLGLLASGRIEILAGGGIRADNVRQLVRSSGCRELHSAVTTIVDETLPVNSSGLHFGITGRADGSYVRCDESKLLALQAELRSIGC